MKRGGWALCPACGESVVFWDGQMVRRIILFSLVAFCFQMSFAQEEKSWEKYMMKNGGRSAERPAASSGSVSADRSAPAAGKSYQKYMRPSSSGAAAVRVPRDSAEDPLPQAASQAAVRSPAPVQSTALPPVREYSAPYEEPVRLPEYGYEEDFAGYEMDDVYSQYFDNSFRPVIRLSGGYTEETQFGDYGATDIATAEFDARLFKVEDFLNTCFDMWIFADGMYFVDNPGMDAIPDGLIAAGVDFGVWWRFINGFSLEFRVAPGIYSDVVEPQFSIPTTANLYYVLLPSLSIQLGATARWGWDMEVMPNVSFLWQPHDFLRVLGGVPYSRIDLFPGHILSFFGTFEWRNTTYALEDSDVLPDEVHFDEMLVSVGATICFMGRTEVSAEAGTYLKREISADVAEDSTVDLSEENFFRITLGSRF